MNDIKRYEWNGCVLETRSADGREVFLLADLVAPLGFKTKKSLEKAFARARKEIGEETWTTPITGVDGRKRPSHVLTPLGVHVLTIHITTEVGVAFRAWVRDTFIRPYLSGARMVTPEMVAEAITKALAVRDAQHAADLAARDRRIDVLIDTQQSLAHAVNETARFGGRMLKLVQDAPEIQALDRAYKLRHEAKPALFPDAKPGEVKPDAAHEWLKQSVARFVSEASVAAPVKTRGLVRRVAEKLEIPRRFVRDAIGDLYLDGTFRRDRGCVHVRPAFSVVPANGGAA